MKTEFTLPMQPFVGISTVNETVEWKLVKK